MKNMIACTSLLLLSLCTKAQTTATQKRHTMNMKMNAGIITTKLDETKKFYQTVLDFGISFENEFYLLMHTPEREAQINFLLPNHPTQQPVFQKPFEGKGLFIIIEVEDADAMYDRIKKLGVKIETDIRNEPWGDRHFAFYDPNGISIDIVTYTNPE